MRSVTRKFICIVLSMAFVVGFVPLAESDNVVMASSFFSDVIDEEDFWFTPTYWGATNNIVYGYSDGTFKPGNQCTRAQMVTFIWRIAGKPEPETDWNPFSDIKESDYWYKPALWGNENGIVYGYSDGTFGPQKNCTRAQAVTFLWRLAGKPDVNSQKADDPDDQYDLAESVQEANKFSDIKQSDYFYKAVLWASEKGIVAGYEDGTFKPQGNCLRRQMVTFLYKFVKAALNEKIDVISLSDDLTLDVDIDYDAIDDAKKATPTSTPTPKPSPTPKPNYKAGKRLGKVPEKQRGSFTLEGKNASEILKMLKSYSKVSTGDVVSKFPKRFPVKPDSTNESGSSCSFRDHYEKYGNDDDGYEYYRSENCITSVSCNAVEEMNGTFTVGDTSSVNIRLFLNDYDVAAELYDLLFKYLKTFEYSDDRFPYVGDDRRTGTNWSSYVYINGSFYSSHIAMQRQTFNNFVGRKEVKRTCFYIEVSIPIKNLNR